MMYGKLANRIKTNKSLSLIIGLIVLWNVYAIFTAFTYAITHDEITFYHKAISSYYKDDFLSLLAHKNEYGYGGFWFSIYTLMIFISEFLTNIDYNVLLKVDSTSTSIYINNLGYIYPLILMKLLNIFSLNVIFYLIIKNYKKHEDNTIFAILFFLITPMFYWSGKFASPDMLSASLIFIGLYIYFYRQKIYLACIILGVSLAIKLSALPILIAIFIYEIIVNFKKLRKESFIPLLKYSIIVYMIFLLLNIYSMVNFVDFIDKLIFYANNHSNHITSIDHLLKSIDYRLFSLSGKAWDLIYIGSLSYFATNTYLIVIFLFLSLFISKKVSINLFFIFAFIVSSVFITRQSVFGWNWFPFIMIFPLLILNTKNNKLSNMILMSFLSLCLIFSFKNIKNEVINKTWQISNLSNFQNNQNEIKKCINKTLESSKIPISQKLNFSEIQLNISGFKSFLQSYWGTKNKYTNGTAILVGDRTSYVLPEIEKEILSKKYTVQQCGFIRIYIIGDYK